MKILVADNEPNIPRLFEQRFRKEYREEMVELHFVTTAEETLAFLEEETHAGLILILAEFDTTAFNDLELLRLIRKEYPAIRIIKVSAYENNELCQQVLAMGADDCMTKPLDFLLLKQKLQL